MKKSIFVSLFIFSSLLLMSCSRNLNDYDYDYIEFGGQSFIPEKEYVFNHYQTYIDTIDEEIVEHTDVNDYNDNFFENHSLILIQFYGGAGEQHQIDSLKLIGNKIIVKQRTTPSMLTALSTYVLFIEVEKVEVENVEFDIVYEKLA